MRERPILFSAPEVRAVLAGRKTMMRRVVKPVRGYTEFNICRPDLAAEAHDVWWHGEYQTVGCMQACPYGRPGDRLWVRETWMPGYDHEADHENGPRVSVIYRADNAERTVAAPSYEFAEQWERDFSEDGVEPPPWRPSIHMPRWASRITPEITSVRVERLQDISEEHALAEGVRWMGTDKGRDFYSAHSRAPGIRVEAFSPTGAPSAKEAFANLWQSINGTGSWDTNPWVWVIEFKRVIQ